MACLGQEDSSSALNIEVVENRIDRLEVGFEWGELYQDRFRNIGKENYTYSLGYRFSGENGSRFGVRLMGVHVEITPGRVGNHQGIDLIGSLNRELKGEIHADRLYFDTYPLMLGFFEYPEGKGYGLRAGTVIGAGLGYNTWRVEPEGASGEFLLNAATIGLSMRFQMVFLEYLVIEYPMVEVFTYLSQGPSPGKLSGNTQRILPDRFGIFSWATISARIPIGK